MAIRTQGIRVTHHVESVRSAVKIKLDTISQFIISIFAMIITLLSFALLSLQIILISLVWMLTSFLNHLNYKLSNYGIQR